MIDYDRIPKTTIETLTAWINSARPMGHFCTAVVSNNLREACARADEENARALFDIVAWLRNYAPIASWGSPQVLKTWPVMLKEIPAIWSSFVEPQHHEHDQNRGDDLAD